MKPEPANVSLSRRSLLQTAAAAVLAGRLSSCVTPQRRRELAAPTAGIEPYFLTRGAVLVVGDLSTLDWPARAQRAGLTTLATHIFPHEIAAFLKTDAGQRFLEDASKLGLQVEHELHAMSDLLPRDLFDQDPTLFPMNAQGDRERAYNLCVHAARAVETACENAVKYTRLLRSTTGRYFYWIDDGRPMCRCPQCRAYSDSDQALLLENAVLAAIRAADPRATLAHLAYAMTLEPPSQVKPSPGIFLEFAPITRAYDRPLSQRDARGLPGPTHGELLDLLDANLAVFGRPGAQVLEYWLDESRVAGWNRAKLKPIPWDRAVFEDDLDTYARRGIRHVTTFGAWIDQEYVRRFGAPPLDDYGAGLLRWTAQHGQPALRAGR